MPEISRELPVGPLQAGTQPAHVELQFDGLNPPEGMPVGSKEQLKIAAAALALTPESRLIENNDVNPIRPTGGESELASDIARLDAEVTAVEAVQIAQREASVERIRQEVSQNVEQVRLDITQGIQGRVVAGIVASHALDEHLTTSPVQAIAAAPAETTAIGPSLPEVRTPILERITRVQEQLFILSIATGASAEPQAVIQGRGDFRGNVDLRHDVNPDNFVTRADRGTDSIPPSMLHSSGGMHSSLDRPPAQLPQPVSQKKLIEKPEVIPSLVQTKRSFDVVEHVIRTCSDLHLLRRMQEGVDLLCYTLFGIVAVGALAGDRVTRFTYRSLREMLATMRSRSTATDIEEVERVVVATSADQLTHVLVDFAEEVDKISASAVADLCGVIAHADTGAPIAGVVLAGGTLGQAITDDRGVFIFRNVPLYTPYEILPMHARYRFTPERIVGRCLELNFDRFSAR